MKLNKYLYFYPGAQNPLGGSSSNTFLIFNEFGILVDPGTIVGHRNNHLIEQIRKDGIGLSKIKEIWITHAHPDHIQLARILAEKFGWRVKCHRDARKIIDTKSPTTAFLEHQFAVVDNYARELMPIFELHLASLLVDLVYGKWHRTKISGTFVGQEIIKNGDLNLEILTIPGHCPIDLGFWLPQEQTLIMGDLIDPRRKQPIPVFNTPSADLNQGIQSLKLMLSLKPKILGLGHGHYLNDQVQIESLIRQNLERTESYKDKALKFLKTHRQYKLIELALALESRRSLSPSGLTMLAFVILKALKQDKLIT